MSSINVLQDPKYESALSKEVCKVDTEFIATYSFAVFFAKQIYDKWIIDILTLVPEGISDGGNKNKHPQHIWKITKS